MNAQPQTAFEQTFPSTNALARYCGAVPDALKLGAIRNNITPGQYAERQYPQLVLLQHWKRFTLRGPLPGSDS